MDNLALSRAHSLTRDKNEENEESEGSHSQHSDIESNSDGKEACMESSSDCNDDEYTKVLIRQEMAIAFKVHDDAIENIVKDNAARTL